MHRPVIETDQGIEPRRVPRANGVEMKHGVSEGKRRVDRIARRPAIAAVKTEALRKKRAQSAKVRRGAGSFDAADARGDRVRVVLQRT